MPEPKTTFFQDYQNLMKDVTGLAKDKANPFFKSKYVSLKDILTEAKRVCLANNFIFYQTTHFKRKEEEGNEMLLYTTLTHISGDNISSTIPIISKDKNDPQKVGAGLTYMRRYSLTCILGIQELDDDGKKASQAPKPTLENIVSSIRKNKDKTTLLGMQTKLKTSKQYTAPQKNLINQAITEALKNAS